MPLAGGRVKPMGQESSRRLALTAPAAALCCADAAPGPYLVPGWINSGHSHDDVKPGRLFMSLLLLLQEIVTMLRGRGRSRRRGGRRGGSMSKVMVGR